MSSKAKPPKKLSGLFSNNLHSSDADRCNYFLDMVHRPDYTGFDGPCLSTTKFMSSSPGHVEFEFTVTEGMCNAGGTMHGGCAATILDDLTSMISLTMMKPGFMDRGTVTRSLSLVYLKPLTAGTKVTCVADAVALGKRLVHIRGELRNEKGEVAVICQHDKVPSHSSKL